jgi:hypothetical protein
VNTTSPSSVISAPRREEARCGSASVNPTHPLTC